ncbi:MBL fold metallo-hydrolase [Bailinhaonella thermotolerans]|uniref:MBL fold metallo-hydrolase n=1 Tax=Bailinhaonella thermotolerans TaxID=1070861 RepID=A0A3A4BS12_9ACTN|nr:MBL fold metallo-hydrolase [Bailinhaonella thermotolerans]RJL34116.1 MBL fold metallo-hydrolase [Bailinhaonella thermotolerans]
MSLTYHSLVTLPPRAVLGDGRRIRPIPAWSPVTATLIAGERDAVLVDAPPFSARAQEVADWIVWTGKNLVAMYATHGGGDRWFGFTEIARRFPGARPLGTPGTVRVAEHEAAAGRRDFWDPQFPGQIPPGLRPLEPLGSHGLELEGHRIDVVEAGTTGARDTTYVHVPDLRLVVGGDVVYNGVHPSLAGTDRASRRNWAEALDAIAALGPSAVVAGHKNPRAADHPGAVEETRAYLRDVEEILATARTPEDFADQMTLRHLDRVNPDTLWQTAQALVPRR